MKISFAWVSRNETYNPQIHCREDEKIFHLDIRQKEAGFAIAKVKIKNPGYGLLWRPENRFCFISFDNEIVFSGRLIGMPTKFKGELIVMDFTAAPDNVENLRLGLIENIKGQMRWDNLFYTDNKIKLSEILQAQTFLPYWCRTTGRLSLSNIFTGNQHLDIAGNFFRDSLDVTINQDPLTAVNVEISAEWTQQGSGTCELGHHIKSACRGGYLSTLTNKSIEKSWWLSGQRIGNTGYKVLDSQLVKLRPEVRLPLSSASDEVWHFEGKPKKVKFPRSWYDMQLRLGWSYRQKRREIAKFTLKQGIQAISGAQKKEKTLTFCLASILSKNNYWQPEYNYSRGFKVIHEGSVYQSRINHVSGDVFCYEKWRELENHVHVDGQSLRSTFFLTDRGQKAIEYALEIAKAHLSASARCISLHFKADLSNIKNISTDHSITINDPRIPGGKATGKVTFYRFTVDGETGENTGHVLSTRHILDF